MRLLNVLKLTNMTLIEQFLLEDKSERHTKSKAYAKEAHEGQFRKGSGDPYVTHPLGVSDILEGYDCSEPACVAGVLHDTVEDTDTTYENLLELFGEDVADLVSELTNSPDFDGLEKENYMSRKLLSLSHEALEVKIADCIWNLLDHPRQAQAERMKRNLTILKDHRDDLTATHKELLRAFATGYKSKIKSFG